MRPSARVFALGALLGLALGTLHLLTGGDTALPLLGAGPARTALVHALWPGFAAGRWAYDNLRVGHHAIVHLGAGFLALALAYGLLALALHALVQRIRR